MLLLLISRTNTANRQLFDYLLNDCCVVTAVEYAFRDNKPQPTACGDRLIDQFQSFAQLRPQERVSLPKRGYSEASPSGVNRTQWLIIKTPLSFKLVTRNSAGEAWPAAASVEVSWKRGDTTDRQVFHVTRGQLASSR